jgi:ribosome-associated translation inhibitor RaiA
MTLSRNTVVNFKDVPNSPAVRSFIEERCEQLAEEFPEELCFEVTIIPEGDGFTAHGHVTGRDIDVAANHDWENEAGKAADQIIEKLHSQLRKQHDKRLFNHRRAARNGQNKRNINAVMEELQDDRSTEEVAEG